MKILNKSILILIIALVILSGCQDDKVASYSNLNDIDNSNYGENSGIENNIKNNTQYNKIDMKIGKLYKIKKGDEIKKNSTEAVIKMVSEIGTDTTEVYLISGEATIIKK